MYFIYGTEDFLISSEEKRITEKLGLQPIIFDSTSLTNDILQEIITVSLFDEEKLIIIRDGEVFDKKENSVKILEPIQKGLNGINIIFVIHQDKPKISNPLIKYLMGNANTKNFNKISSRDIMGVVKTSFVKKGGTISPKALILLSSKLPANLMIINNEIDKLLLLKNDIDVEDVDKAVSDYTSDEYFALANAILKKDETDIFTAYYERIREGDDPHILIGQIASVLLLTNRINSYLSMGYSSKDISDETKIHIFRVKKARELLNKVSGDELKVLIENLSKLDTDIKTGKIESKIGLEKFLLDFLK